MVHGGTVLRKGDGGVIAVDRWDGILLIKLIKSHSIVFVICCNSTPNSTCSRNYNIAMAFNSVGMYRGAADNSGRFEVGVFEELQDDGRTQE